MRLRGEITVFLSLVMVCVLSLLLSLVESARTAGARLYLEMSANSALTSVMSQYNRNLWDMYHVLFLEAESDDAVEESFSSYLNYYLEQENLYPIKLNEVDVTGKTMMMDHGGLALEQEILSYVMYRIPDVAADLSGLTEAAEDAAKAGDFQELFDICRRAGRNTRGLETCRDKIESCLDDLQDCLEDLEEELEREIEADFEDEEDMDRYEEARLEKERRLERCMKDICEVAEDFSRLIKQYEEQVQILSEHMQELKREESSGIDTEHIGNSLSQEILAYEQVISSATAQLEKYQKAEAEMRETLENCEAETLPIGEWSSLVRGLRSNEGSVDQKKWQALNRVEELLQGDLLTLVLPENRVVSKKEVTLNGVPSVAIKENGISDMVSKDAHTLLQQCMVNEYCFLSFDSFLEQCERDLEPVNQPLLYEQEYLLGGYDTDRENLLGTVERLLSVRAGMNLLFLVQSPEHRASAEGLAAAVSGGIVPLQFILSFFIMTLWSLGEAVCDLKQILKGGNVPFWKGADDWKISIDSFLALEFLDFSGDTETFEQPEGGNDYEDYLRILFALMDKQMRNGRMMDVMQWNLGTVQEDFRVSDCIADVRIQASVTEQHLFAVKTEYERSVEVNGDY